MGQSPYVRTTQRSAAPHRHGPATQKRLPPKLSCPERGLTDHCVDGCDALVEQISDSSKFLAIRGHYSPRVPWPSPPSGPLAIGPGSADTHPWVQRRCSRRSADELVAEATGFR